MSTGLIIIGCLVLIGVVLVQIGRVTELASKIRGEEEVQYEINRQHGLLSLLFMIGFLVFCFWTAAKYKNWILWYGPHESASAHGGMLDSLFDVTLVFTGIVFILTQIALFYFAWKYAGKKGQKVSFIPHDNKLEIIWTAIPAVVMCFLVVRGLVAWNIVTADMPEDAIATLRAENPNEYIEIEATGAQFLWYLRYPGADGKLGERNYKLTSASNPLGQNWHDKKNADDFHPTEIVLPKGRPVRVRITARDVLHNFYLPHFRVKMDAVPGIPTYFKFTPTLTTEEYRQKLKTAPEYHQPTDPKDPTSEPRWKTFEYELACAELCGKGHFSMKKILRVVEPEVYDEWLEKQQSFYYSSIRNTDEDPYNGDFTPWEIDDNTGEFNTTFDNLLGAADSISKIVRLKYVTFETGSYTLTSTSRYQLGDVAEKLKKHPGINIELGGHTDNTGNADANLILSESRANAVMNFLINKEGVPTSRLTAVGYGQNNPVADNATEEGQQENRRTELKILAQ